MNQSKFKFEYSNFNKNRFKNKLLRRFEIRASIVLNKKVPGNCDFNELVYRYKKVFNAQLIIGQIHPVSYNLKNLKELEKFLWFVLNEGEHQFITPKKFVEKQTKNEN